MSTRWLNRAMLARQLLLERVRAPALRVVEHLVGLQAQASNPPYVGLWSRLDGFVHDELSTLLTERRAVRGSLMRGTIHLVSADDFRWLRPLVHPVYERALSRPDPRRRDVKALDLEAVCAQARALVEERPRTRKELRELLGASWPRFSPEALAFAAHCALALVQVPPRGLWGVSGQPAWTTAEAWLGQPMSERASTTDLVRRYLAAFGPASVRDAQAWSGLTRLSEVFEQLRPELLVFRDEAGRELFDLPEAPRPGANVLAPVRLVAEFDNLLLSHADRSRVLTDEHRRRIFPKNGLIPGTVLIDGFVAGTWKFSQGKGHATLTVRTFTPPSDRDEEAIRAEGGALLSFVDGATEGEVEVVSG